MEALALAAAILSALLLVGVILLWRAALQQAAERERDLRTRLAAAETAAALGEAARRAWDEHQAELLQARSAAAQADIRAATAQATGSAAQQQVQDLQQQVASARAALSALQDRLQATEGAAAGAQAEALSARERAEDLRGRLAAAEASAQLREEERGSLLRRLADGEAARATAAAEADAARSAEAELRQRLAVTHAGLERAQAELAAATTLAERLRGELSQSEALAHERLQAQERAREQLTAHLQALVKQFYDDQGRAMLGEGKQQLEQTLQPFRARLQELQARIDLVHASDLQDRAALQNELKGLIAAQTRLSSEAEQLGRALRADTKAQGTWGELTLHRLLESSQLERGCAYDLQVSVKDDAGSAGRPDAVIFLPEGKAMAIDAKVSLTHFIAATNASSEEERQAALRSHLASVRAHMRGLAQRDYPEAIAASLRGHSLDLTLLFLPSEAAFAAAVSQDHDLWSEAFKQHIIIVSPTTLLVSLRVVAHIWRVEGQNRNAAAIAKEAGIIVEKIRTTLDDFDAVERSLHLAQEAFAKARGKLMTGKGNIVRKAETIIRLGATVKDGTRDRILKDGEEDEAADPPTASIPRPDALGSSAAPSGSDPEESAEESA